MTAQRVEAKQAVGRYRSLAREGEPVDPVTELQNAATESLLSVNVDTERVASGAKSGRHAALQGSDLFSCLQ